MKYPSSWHGDMWREATPVGSGEIGGLVYGAVYKETIALTHGKLWAGGVTQPLPDVSSTLPLMRKLLDEDKPIEAEKVMCDAFSKFDYAPKNAKPYPLCDIEIITRNDNRFKNYKRVLDMEKAESEISWEDGEIKHKRRFFISRLNDTACFEETSTGGKCSVELKLKIHDLETVSDIPRPQNEELIISEGEIKFSASIEGRDFGAVAKIYHNGREIIEKDKYIIEDADNITVFTKVFINSSRKDSWETLHNELTAVNCYEDELLKSAELHGKLFSSAILNLCGENYEKTNEEYLMESFGNYAPTELIEKLWSFGRYLLICSTKKNSYPCQLYGLWTGSYKPVWAFNMFNVNIEMIYWQAVSNNMPELLISIFDYLEDKIEDFRENAKKLYNCRGLNMSCVSTPESGLHKNLQPHILHWTPGLAWICQFYFDYYLITGDIEFLKNRAMPFMKETLLFYEDFLVLDNNGYYKSYPSNSPENTPKNVFDKVKRICEVTVNSTMDFAIVKELINNLLKGIEITGKYSEHKELWESMLDKIPPYQLNDDNTIREWMHPYYDDNHEHRHQSHLYPVFPGYEVTKHNNPELFDAAFNTIEKRRKIGLKDQSSWSLVYMSNVYARLGKGKIVSECIDSLTSTNLLPNLFTVHNDWRRMGTSMCDDIRSAPVQLDANMGFTSMLTETLVFSTPDEIYLFAGLDKNRFPHGNAGEFTARTGSLISVEWNGHTATVKLKQKHFSKKIVLHLPEYMFFEENRLSNMEINVSENEEYIFNIITD